MEAPYNVFMNPSDQELLERFTSKQDASAFEELIKRHGPMIMGVCRRILPNSHDAEDVFQSTFIVLTHKAASLSHHRSIRSWLYRVTVNAALKAKASAARRAQYHEPLEEEMHESVDQNLDHAWAEIRPVIDEEINRLPEKLRVPVVLCYFVGKTYEEAGCELGLTHLTIKMRLERARNLLRERFKRHDITLSSGIVASLLAQKISLAEVPAQMMTSTVKAATHLAVGNILTTTGLSPQTITITKGILKALVMEKLKVIIIGIAVVVGLGLGIGITINQLQKSHREKASHSLPKPVSTESKEKIHPTLNLEKIRKENADLLTQNRRLQKEIENLKKQPAEGLVASIPSNAIHTPIVTKKWQVPTELAQVLELTKEEQEQMNAIYKAIRDSIKQMTRNRATIKESTPDHVTINVSPFPEEGKKIQEQLYSSIQPLLGPDRFTLFKELNEHEKLGEYENPFYRIGTLNRTVTFSIKNSAYGLPLSYSINDRASSNLSPETGAQLKDFQDNHSYSYGYESTATTNVAPEPSEIYQVLKALLPTNFQQTFDAGSPQE